MTTFGTGIVTRLRRLADRLADLRDQLRAAAATEVGRAVGEAARDLLSAALAGRPARPLADPTPRDETWRDRWADDPDDWDPDCNSGPDPDRDRSTVPPPVVHPSGWAAAVSAGAAGARWWAGRTGRPLVGLAAGLLAVAGSLIGGSTVAAALGVFTALADLAAGG